MKLKIDLSLPKLMRLRVGFRLGLDEGAAVDLKLKLAGGEPLRWKLALAPGKARALAEPRGHDEAVLPPAPPKITSG